MTMTPEHTFTEENIRRMVYDFYDGVRRDELLGPVFDAALSHGWDEHLPRMVDFWSTVLLGTRKFQSNVFGKHMALQGIEKEHFIRWLALFRATAARVYAPEQADEVVTVAERIATSLQLGYFGEKRA